MSIKNKKSLLIIVVIIALLCVGGVAAFFVWNRDDTPTSRRTPQNINYDPPTEQEQRAGDEKKKEISDEKEEEPPVGQAVVTITYAGPYEDAVEVGAYTSSVVEEGGTCKLTLKQGSKEVSTTTAAVANAHSSDCPTLSIARSKLGTGTWSAIVTYTSPTTSGASAAKEITIQ